MNAPIPTPAPFGGLDLRADLSLLARQRLAWRDLRDTARMWRLVLALGWLDIRLRYRGSVIGPFWLTLSTALMVGALGFVYSTLFHQDLREYLPYLALSLVLWNALSAVVSEACVVFTQNEASIRSIRAPFATHAARLLVRQGLTLAHNAAVIVAVYAIFRIWPGWRMLLAVPGGALWLADGMAACLLLGSFCARFRDIPQIIASIMQIAFFVTPIVWKPEQMRENARFLPLNPFYTLLDVVRAPLLGVVPSATVWLSAALFSLALWAAAWMLFARVRGRLAFWV